VSRDIGHGVAGNSRPEPALPRLRLDKWLWHARFFKTRSLASRFVGQARLRLDGRVVDKPSVAVSEGATLTFALGDRVRIVRVLRLGARRGPPAEARLLYADLGAPPPAAIEPSNAASVVLAPVRSTG